MAKKWEGDVEKQPMGRKRATDGTAKKVTDSR